MTWEHRSNGGQWVVTVGAWHAAVQRVAGARCGKRCLSGDGIARSLYEPDLSQSRGRASGASGRSPNLLAGRRDVIFRASPEGYHRVG